MDRVKIVFFKLCCSVDFNCKNEKNNFFTSEQFPVKKIDDQAMLKYRVKADARQAKSMTTSTSWLNSTVRLFIQICHDVTLVELGKIAKLFYWSIGVVAFVIDDQNKNQQFQSVTCQSGAGEQTFKIVCRAPSFNLTTRFHWTAYS
ncbi:hypothetical protein T4B_15483 [Trichinella pseudospiralis]|uniref:Uncharacterized protein n=1 Tax=Trichinella pseudospiralis TaxID=6337 RepID=A0A0V1IGT2_TRIPS|nr:hypothetical protein T4B_15483 [Trichinella pseudospiralis]